MPWGTPGLIELSIVKLSVCHDTLFDRQAKVLADTAMPNLRTLEIDFAFGKSCAVSKESWLALLDRASKPKLEQLRLRNPWGNEEPLLAALHALEGWVIERERDDVIARFQPVNAA
jgi:hypothetical protein